MGTKNEPKPALAPDALYFGDNGRCFCGAHAGMTARYTGRDLSGRRVHKVTEADRAYAKREGWAIGCEECREPR